ncbi:MAG: amidohydrolase family protein [Fidelibacterota bacterium]|nr:MAG: amidohydrolase family protein [Candidatus Neomarinimicrobiota bacterium]
MKISLLILVPAASFLLVLTSCADNDDADDNSVVTGPVAVTHVSLVAMTDENIAADQTVVVENGRISAVGAAAEVTIPAEATVIDGAGAYLMPGLADMHVHTRDDWLESRWPVSPLHLFLANGVTTIRDFGPNGVDLTYPLEWRDEISKGTMMGPTLYTSGIQVRYDRGTTLSPQAIVDWNYAQGFDFLKVYSYVSASGFQEAMATARQLGMYTAGHITYTVGLEGVVAAGYDEIAHVEELDWEFVELNRDTVLAWENWLPYLIGNVLQQADVAAGFDPVDFQTRYGDRLAAVIGILQSNNIPLSTTLIVDDLIVEKLFNSGTFLSRPELIYLPQDYLAAFNQGVEKHQMQFQGIEALATYKYGLDKLLLTALHQAGIPLFLATDAGTGTMGIVPGFSIHDELRLLVENGFTPYEAIAAGTVVASEAVEAMTGEDEFGTIEVGKRADLILVNENPLEDVAHIKDHRGVMAAGSWYSEALLEEMITVAD